jgi:hypothetical protein
MVSVLASDVVGRGFIVDIACSPRVLYINDEPTIYSHQGEHANHYISDEPTIYSTRSEHANHYINDEPTIYSTRGHPVLYIVGS